MEKKINFLLNNKQNRHLENGIFKATIFIRT